MKSQVNPHTDGVTDEQLLCAVYHALGPRGADPAPLTDAQAAEIVQRANARRRERRRLRRRFWCRGIQGVGFSAAVVAAVLVMGNVLGIGRNPDSRPPAGRGGAAGPPVITLPDPSQWQSARAGLTALAGAVRERVEPHPPGRYTYTRTRSWSVDTTSDEPYQNVTVRDEQRWWALDHSGREAIAAVPHWIPGTAPGPVPRPDTDTRYAPGLLPVVVPELSDDVFLVSSQLADQGDPADGPQQTLRAVREVYRYHAPTSAQRGALLQALADTSGLMTAGTVDGGPGRRGLAVVVDSDHGTTRDIAVFDPSDGRLLAYDTVVLRNTKAVHLPAPAVSDSVLYIAADHTDRL